jgi:hypothetical protein
MPQDQIAHRGRGYSGDRVDERTKPFRRRPRALDRPATPLGRCASERHRIKRRRQVGGKVGRQRGDRRAFVELSGDRIGPLTGPVVGSMSADRAKALFADRCFVEYFRP